MSDNNSSSRMNQGEQQPAKAAILCDMCPADCQRAALKTCLKCEISMCGEHLQPHLTTPVLLLTHPLADPLAPGTEGLAGTKCPQHGKLVEYYCLDDMACVCVACAIEDQHRLHNMKTLPKAQAELREKLQGWEQAVAARKPASTALQRWEKTRREELGRSSALLIEVVSKLRDVALNPVRSSVTTRTAAVTVGGSSIQAAMGEKDMFRFLQLCSQVDVERATAVDLRTGLESGEERDKIVQELQVAGEDMLTQATKLWGSVLMFVDPENHQEVSGNALATFDPLALGTGMLPSKDHMRVYYTKEPTTIPQTTLMIKSANDEPVHSWTIAVSENCDWTVGFCDNASARGNVPERYALCLKGDQLSYLTGVDNTEQSVTTGAGEGAGAQRMSRPESVEVSWSPASSTVSFFSRSSERYGRRLIVSLDVSRDSPPLNPFVTLWSTAAHEQEAQEAHQQEQQRVHRNAKNPIRCTELLCELS